MSIRQTRRATTVTSREHLQTDGQAEHLTVSEMADQLRVSPTFIRREIWAGRICAARFGRAVRIPVEEAKRYASERLGQLGRRSGDL